MVEREPRSTRQKLLAAVTLDYPGATEISVTFPDEWELVYKLRRDDVPLYIAALPAGDELPREDRFPDLTAKINLDLTCCRMFKLFKPRPLPSVIASRNESTGRGQVEETEDMRVHLQPIGRAQAFFGRDFGVVWECYLNGQTRVKDWQEELRTLWQVVENEMNVAEIFAPAPDPGRGDDYPALLRNLGYAPDPDFGGWWSKWGGEA